MDYNNKTVLITGASRGIGAQTAIQFASLGYNVIINYNKSEKQAISVFNKIKSFDGRAIIYKADVSKREEVNNMFRFAYDVFDRIDILVNNAGIAQQKLFTDITESEWDLMFDINVKGMYNCCQLALPDMIHYKQGKIINMSSIWGISGASCEVHYSAAKAAVIGFTKALAKEVGPSGITVNCIAPGVIDTDMNGNLDSNTISALLDETPLEKLGQPEDIANVIMFLASDKADFITGQIISPNGGFVI